LEGRFERAIECHQRVLEIEKDNFAARLGIAVSSGKLGNQMLESAKSIYDAGLQTQDPEEKTQAREAARPLVEKARHYHTTALGELLRLRKEAGDKDSKYQATFSLAQLHYERLMLPHNPYYFADPADPAVAPAVQSDRDRALQYAEELLRLYPEETPLEVHRWLAALLFMRGGDADYTRGIELLFKYRENLHKQRALGEQIPNVDQRAQYLQYIDQEITLNHNQLTGILQAYRESLGARRDEAVKSKNSRELAVIDRQIQMVDGQIRRLRGGSVPK
jgi:hypothetical protein